MKYMIINNYVCISPDLEVPKAVLRKAAQSLQSALDCIVFTWMYLASALLSATLHAICGSVSLLSAT